MKGQFRQKFRHVHLLVADLNRNIYLNPLKFISSYQDHQAPVVKNIYLIDPSARISEGLTSGELEVGIEAYDLDDAGERNFEISSISYEARDESGHILGRLNECSLDSLTEPIYPPNLISKDFLDLEGSVNQTNSDVLVFPNDGFNSQRTFKYLVNRLKANSGHCSVDVSHPTIKIEDAIKRLVISGFVTDAFGNKSAFKRVFLRNESEPPRGKPRGFTGAAA